MSVIVMLCECKARVANRHLAERVDMCGIISKKCGFCESYCEDTNVLVKEWIFLQIKEEKNINNFRIIKNKKATRNIFEFKIFIFFK